MSMFENDRYRWRETYFVLFRSGRRPTLETVQKTLSALSDRFTLANLSADEDGQFDSLTLVAPDDFAALDICYTGGAEVLEQGAMLAEEMTPLAREIGDEQSLSKIRQCDARFDVLHFEEITDLDEDDDEAEEMLDPSALLLVLGALAKISDGIAMDPQGGTILSDED